jgi:hypothetical protein
MAELLAGGQTATGRSLPQVAARKNVLAIRRYEPDPAGSDGFDSYVNEIRDFVMELCFPSQVGLCETGPVKRSIHLCRLLAVLVIVGLVIAPLTARANTGATASMTMTAMSDDTAAMSEDMPCCPDKSAPVDCDQCPLMALCVSTTLQAPLPAGVAEIQPVTLRMLLPGSDPEVESVGYSPPPKPPRSLVRSA